MNIGHWKRITIAVPVVLAAIAAVAGWAGSAAAQTVEEYETALAQARRGSPAVAGDDDACLPLVNYTFVSITMDERTEVCPVIRAYEATLGAVKTDAETMRGNCLAQMSRPVIAFDGGFKEDIVPQPAIEPLDRPVADPGLGPTSIYKKTRH